MNVAVIVGMLGFLSRGPIYILNHINVNIEGIFVKIFDFTLTVDNYLIKVILTKIL